MQPTPRNNRNPNISPEGRGGIKEPCPSHRSQAQIRVTTGCSGHWERQQNRLLSVFSTVTTRISATSCNGQAVSPLACAQRLSTKSICTRSWFYRTNAILCPMTAQTGAWPGCTTGTLCLRALGQQTFGFGARPQPGPSPELPTGALR